MLFLFSDVSENDAPTRIRQGSHMDVARVLQPFGEKGLSFMELGWAIHALRTGTVDDSGGHIACIRILFKAGADITALNAESRVFLESLSL